MKGQYHTSRPAALLATALLGMHRSQLSPQASHMLAYNAVGVDIASGFQEGLHPWTVQAPWALKAKASKDPDLPSVPSRRSKAYSQYMGLQNQAVP
jgi:hypothetical protein